MNHTIKYILIHAESFMMMIVFIIGIAAASSGEFLFGLACILAPFVYGNLINYEKHLTYIEVYERALDIKDIKLKNTK